MSTSEEIRSVFDDEIYRKSMSLANKRGMAPFYDDFRGFSIEDIHDHLGVEKIICSEFLPRDEHARKTRTPTEGHGPTQGS